MTASGNIHFNDKQTLRDAYDKYFAQLCFFGHRYLEDMVEVEDVVQDIFVTLFEKKMAFDSPAAMDTYLRRAVYNACMNRLNHAKIRRRHMPGIAERMEAERENDSGFTGDAIEDAMLWRIMRAVDELPPECARVFRLSYIERRGINEVAEIMGISPHTVNSQRTRAKKLLKEKLKHLYPFALLLYNIMQ